MMHVPGFDRRGMDRPAWRGMTSGGQAHDTSPEAQVKFVDAGPPSGLVEHYER
jgi:hypothetical protein